MWYPVGKFYPSPMDCLGFFFGKQKQEISTKMVNWWYLWGKGSRRLYYVFFQTSYNQVFYWKLVVWGPVVWIPNWKGFRKGIEMYSFIFTSQTFLLMSNLELITQPISTMQTLPCLRNDWRKIHTPSRPLNVVLQGIFVGPHLFQTFFCCNKKSKKDKLRFIQGFLLLLYQGGPWLWTFSC